jgi:hypothetical protein
MNFLKSACSDIIYLLSNKYYRLSNSFQKETQEKIRSSKSQPAFIKAKEIQIIANNKEENNE